MSKHLHTLRAITLCIIALLGTAHSSRCQTPIVVCDVTEICLCLEGIAPGPGEPDPGLNFILCPALVSDTSGIVALFCSGQLPTMWVMRAYDDTSNTGLPIPSLTGEFQNYQGVNGTSFSNRLHLEFDVQNAAQSCATGDYPPLRLLVYPFWSAPTPQPGDCIGAGANCTNTGIVTQHLHTTFVVDASGRVKLPSSFAATGDLLVHDMQGRLVEHLRLSANQGWLYLGDLGVGIYMARIAGGAVPIAFRVVVE